MIRRRAWLTARTLMGVVALLFAAVCPSAFAGGDINTAECPNETLPGYTAALPDCRAYEMTSPPFKGGVEVQDILAISPSGDEAIGRSAGAFAGTQSNSLPTLYQLDRTSQGWSPRAINSPASVFPAFQTGTYIASTNLQRTLWTLRTGTQSVFAADLYSREPNGSFVRIGPMAPPSASQGPSAGGSQLFRGRYLEVGASGDLSHVFFAIENGFNSSLWPGDTTAERGEGDTGGTSLYEYTGTGKSVPALVAVDGNGKLISNCSSFLGSDESKDVYNAISEDGETIYFTARGHNVSQCNAPVAPEVSELYARLGGIETVSISEPTAAQCAECAVGPKLPAEFQGASKDGSKVFFLTEQELLSGTTMNLYEYDSQNAPGKKLLRVSTGSATPEVQGVARVSEDGSHVYFVAKGVLTEGSNAEGRVPVLGGENLYVFERDAKYLAGRMTFIGTLADTTEEELEAKLVTCEEEPDEASREACRRRAREVDARDWATSDEGRPVQVTPDGRYLVFESLADLTAGDTSTEHQIFEYDAEQQRLVRVSVGQDGFSAGTANADQRGASILRQRYITNVSPTEANNRLSISADGSVILFSSRAALTEGAQGAAAAGAQSSYEYRSAGSIANGNVYLLSDGTDPLGSRPVSLSQSGADAWFVTADPLLAQDVDTQFDIYDARADGGLPTPPTPAACDGEACQGHSSTQPLFASPSSAVTAPTSTILSAPASAPVPAKKSTSLAHGRTVTRLAKALKTCRRKRLGHARIACEKRAQRAYGGTKRKARGAKWSL